MILAIPSIHLKMIVVNPNEDKENQESVTET